MKKITLNTLSLDDLARNRGEKEEEQLLSKTLGLSLEDSDQEKHNGDVEMSCTSSGANSLTPARSIHNTMPSKYTLPASVLKHAPFKSSPLKNCVQASPERNDTEQNDDQDNQCTDDREQIDDSDILMEDDDGDHGLNLSLSQKISDTTIAILSPTILGARVATHSGSPSVRKNLTSQLFNTAENSSSSESSCDSDESFASNKLTTAYRGTPELQKLKLRKTHNPTISSSALSKVTSSQDDSDDDVEAEISTSFASEASSPIFKTPSLKTPWGNAPIQLQMHHHHYYPPSSPDSYFGSSSPYKNDQVVVLPAPWSKKASPKAPTPYLISSYLQLLFNIITSSVVLYILFSFIQTVKNDINIKMEQYAVEIALEVSRCTASYIENKCAPDTIVPTIEKKCSEWEKCMNRDPSQHAGKASVSAETIGVILNSLIEPIGVKAMAVFTAGLVAWAFTSNFIFGFVRAKSYYGWHYNQDHQNELQWNQPQLQQNSALPPALLHSVPSTPGGWDYSYATPTH